MSSIKELAEFVDRIHHYELELMTRKCNDYSGQEDCNKNIKACEVMGLVDVETGLLVRLLDKLQRLITLKKTGSPMVKDERKQDTVHDMRIYLAAYLFILEENERRKFEGSVLVADPPAP